MGWIKKSRTKVINGKIVFAEKVMLVDESYILAGEGALAKSLQIYLWD